MTATMAAQKKLASLRLDEEILERIDAVIERLYKGLPVAPSRNAVLEAWIRDGLEDAELKAEAQGMNEADRNKKNAVLSVELDTPSRVKKN